MLNQAVIVGRIVGEPNIKEENGKKSSNLVLAVPRSYKNENGEYDTDFLECTIWNGIAESVCEYCKKGDLVGVKGRLESKTIEKNGQKERKMNIVAEKITYLSSKSKDKEEDNEL
jgi:single-strand DNA-binding protein